MDKKKYDNIDDYVIDVAKETYKPTIGHDCWGRAEEHVPYQQQEAFYNGACWAVQNYKKLRNLMKQIEKEKKEALKEQEQLEEEKQKAAEAAKEAAERKEYERLKAKFENK